MSPEGDPRGEFRPFSVHLLNHQNQEPNEVATNALQRDSLKRESYDLSREDTEICTMRTESHLEALIRNQPLSLSNAANGS